MKSNADKHGMKSAAKREPHEHHDHHANMAADFRKQFWVSLVLTLPILVLSPFLQKLVGLREAIGFAGDLYVLFGLSTAVFFSTAAGRSSKGCTESLPRASPG